MMTRAEVEQWRTTKLQQLAAAAQAYASSHAGYVVAAHNLPLEVRTLCEELYGPACPLARGLPHNFQATRCVECGQPCNHP